MAWLKEMEHETNGSIATYWDVISIEYAHKIQKSIMKVGGWKDQAAYENDKVPIIIKTYEIEAGQAPELARGALAFVVNYVKQQEEFQGYSEVE